MIQTHTFHTVSNGTTYTFETNGTLLVKVKVKVYQQPPVTHERIGHPVDLDDLKVNIGNDLSGMGTNNPELRAILQTLKRQAA